MTISQSLRLAALLIITGALPGAAAPLEVTLAAGGRAAIPVVVAPGATKQVKAAAATLAEYLGRLSGAQFTVETGNGQTGIALGLSTDFPELRHGIEFDLRSPQRREDYLLRSHGRGIWLLGATELAVENAAWDLLHRLGHRQFFPGKNWEVVPPPGDLKIAADTLEQPDYAYRRIWYGYGSSWDGGAAAPWLARNRMQAAFQVNTGHAYDAILEDLAAELKAHPEYLCQVNGKPTNKLNIANPELRRLVVGWALAKMEKRPDTEVLSLEPSDGGGWGRSEAELALGPISNRVVMLANEVAAALNVRFAATHGRKFVGIYAYNEHALPPTIRVNENVIVLVATAYNKSGLTIDQLMAGWQKQGATVGIREYYSVSVSSKDRPGASKAADPRAIAASIPHFHRLGARFMSAESGNSWGSIGLGHYVAARLLWDVGESYEAIVDDFFARAFGPAEPPMREFYRLIDGAGRPALTRQLVGGMYRRLRDARALTDDPGIRARLDDLTLYTRFVELLMNIKEPPTEVEMILPEKPAATAEDDLEDLAGLPADMVPPPKKLLRKQDGTERVLSFAYRIRKTNMVHSLALWRDTRGGGFRPLSSSAGWQVPEGKNPWKNSDPVTAAEIGAFISNGIAANPVVEFTPVEFSSALAPVELPASAQRPRLPANTYTRRNIFHTWVGPEKVPVRLQASVVMRGTPLPARALLQRADQPALEPAPPAVDDEDAAEGEDAGDAPALPEIIAEASAEIKVVDGVQEIVLTPTGTGLYRVVVECRGKTGVKLDWPENQPMAHETTPANRPSIYHRFERYFYVPPGTPAVAGFVQATGTVRDADGKEVFRTLDRAAYFKIPVAPNQDGRLWSISGAYPSPIFFTVPPYLFRSAAEMLLPKE